MKELKFVVCGTGCRGTWLALNVVSELEDVVITAVCDPYADKAESLASELEKKGCPRPAVYTDHKVMLDTEKADAALVSTSWEAHVEVAVYAMKKGIATAMEVGGAYCEEDCRLLVETYEETKTPFMFMENCCYNKDELLVTSLVRNGKFGEVVYCHGAYAHDLRNEVAYGDKNRHYRLRNYSSRNCENYPTHELGPIAKLLNITRGNRMVSLSARASKSAGLHEYVRDKEGLEYLTDREFAQGDIVETLISCENGELISLKLDTTLPRFYSREFTVRGTCGGYIQDINAVFIEGEFVEDFNTEKCVGGLLGSANKYSDYLPDIWKYVDEETLKRGHGGMDWFEFVAFADALRSGSPMPIDVYDAAAWMCVTYLSEISIKNGGASVEIPDFTGGKYKERMAMDVVPFPEVASK